MTNLKKEIIQNTLNNKFDIINYKEFIKEFFNDLSFFDNTRYDYIWTEYANTVKSYYKIGNFIDKKQNKLIILAVELKKSTSIDRARSMQRNFISKILKDNNMEAAIVAFYTADEPNWRLSFVRLDYSFTNNRLSIKLTPAKRYSYLVGENEPNHTAQEQLFPLFENEKENPTIDEIEEAFSIEKVTKSFFNQYKEKFLQLKECLVNDKAFITETEKLGFEIDKFSEQFAKKLMGQLSFLYFIQKKGWLGVSLLPTSDSISKIEYTKIYNEQDLIHKEILYKILKENSDNYYFFSQIDIKNLDEHQSELLSDCFTNTIYDQTWGNGNKKFIRNIFNQCSENNKNNFFEDFLEPLFYEALNKNRKKLYFNRFNCKIPFLNGGLFEPLEGYNWKHIIINIPNTFFSNKKELGENATGLLDIFDRYNFTMNESEPLEKEVAVDPEMLGKIFENLLTVRDRKSKGAFYTPREIVHYMCQECLINYLVKEVNISYDDIKEFILFGELIKDEDNSKDYLDSTKLIIKKSILDNIIAIDDALKTIRIADPAVGSGAYPLGMLNEIVKARNNITEYILKNNNKKVDNYDYKSNFIKQMRSPYKLKWETIKNCIFAVDIEPSAVDITKLRLWLSVVVDQEINKDNKAPHPLPNLDMNIHVGNSLIEEYEGIKLFDESMLVNKKNKQKRKKKILDQLDLIFNPDEILNEIFKNQSQYFGEHDDKNKKYLKERIEILQDQLISIKLFDNSDAIYKYKEIQSQKFKPYFIWSLEFAKIFQEKNGFDIMIGNPPYIKEYTNSKIFEPLKKNPYYQGKMDLWYFFACKGLDLLNEKGIQCFIAQSNWTTSSGASKLRNKIITDSKIIKFFDFGNYKVFESASIQTMIYFLSKEKPIGPYEMSYSKLQLDNPSKNQLTNFLFTINNSTKNLHYTTTIEPKKITNSYLLFIPKIVNLLLDKISSDSITLNKNEIHQGIVAPQDNLNKNNAEILGSPYEIGMGIFVLTLDEISTLNFTENEKLILKPFYTSIELSKYFCNQNTYKKIIYSKSDMNSIIEDYPNIKKHLDEFSKIITSSNKPYGLHRARSEKIFKGEKILSLRKCSSPTFTYSNNDCYVSQTYNIIKTNQINQLYLVALLNSKLVKFWLKYKGKLQGNNYQIDKEPLLEIPIKEPNNEIINEVIKHLDNIKNDITINASISKIDDIIYKIYHLTEYEIQTIEQNIN